MLLYIELLCVLLIVISSIKFRGTYSVASSPLPFGVTGVIIRVFTVLVLSAASHANVYVSLSI